MAELTVGTNEDRAQRIARGMILSSRLSYFSVSIEEVEQAGAFVRAVFGYCVTDDGAPVSARWCRWRGASSIIEVIEGLERAPSEERQLIVLDLSGIDRGELSDAMVVARALNHSRDTLSRQHLGALLLCLPSWAEARFAEQAPDFWSRVSSALLEREPWSPAAFDAFRGRCDGAFTARRTSLPVDAYAHGTSTFAYAYAAHSLDLTNQALLAQLGQLPQYTGWPVWLVGSGDHAPYAIDGVVEAWLRPPLIAGTNDFWRASASGMLYLRRSHQEDGNQAQPGAVLWASLPIWRIGEALLHAHDLGQRLGLRPETGLHIHARWDGLSGRHLAPAPQDPMAFVPRDLCRTAMVESKLVVELGDLADDLVSSVQALTAPLFDCFGFYKPSNDHVARELEQLKQRMRA